ncbi:MAG: hypothetical protein ABI461_07860 [Polyangiaceae bacterium]
MSVLVPCPGCARHVRASESACPFCSADLPNDLASRAVPAATRRMSRGAVFTFAATVVVGSVVACGGDIVVDQGGGQTMYGLANIEDSGAYDSGQPMPPYGIAYVDSGEDDGGGILPMYGAAYPDDAGDGGDAD